ncbi:MAG: SdrD B-like domain-containing protein [Ferruginibacter sp.]
MQAGSLLWNTGESSASITVTSAGTYTVTTTVNGCTSEAGSAVAAPKSTPATPVVTVTNNCGNSVLSTTATGTLLWNTGQSTASITVTTAGTYTVTTTVNGCISIAGSGIAAPKAIPTAPTVGAIIQPTCSVATGSVTLSNLPSGSWTLTRTPGNVVTTGTTATTTISGLAAGTYTYTVTNAVGCVSGSTTNIVISAQPATPAKPVIGTITQPTCAVPTGSVVLSSLPAGAWTITSTPSTFTTTGNTTTVTITGIPANNTYVFKVTNASGCTSPASGSVQINAQPALPATPTATVTQPTCTNLKGSITVTSSKTGLKFSIDGVTYTNTTGSFTNLNPGTYNLTARNAAGCISLPRVITITAQTNCASIGNFVFKDANANGKQDGTETGIGGVTVNLLNSSGTQIASTTTSSSGAYAFNNLAAGTYSVRFVTPTGYYPTASNVGTDDTKDSDPVNGVVNGIVLTSAQANTSVDAGFIPAVISLGNRVWYDANNDGINGSSENGIANVTVRLYQDNDNNNIADGAAIATKTTDASGYFNFTALAPGNYILGAVLPNGYISSAINAADPDNNINSDDNGSVLVANEIRGLAITLTNTGEPESSGKTNNSYDFGMLPDCNCINTSGNLLTNGSFESGTTGWTASGGSVSTGTGYTACGSKNAFNNASKKLSEVYQDVNITAGTTVTFSGYAGIHTAGLSCSPKISLIFRSSSGAVLGRTDVAVTRDVDLNYGQLALYTITATAPAGTAKVRVQTSTTCNAMKMDAFCLRVTGTGRGDDIPGELPVTVEETTVSDIATAFDVKVYPNPVTSFLNLTVQSSDRNSTADVRILNTDGKVMVAQKATSGQTSRINTTGWKAGMYFVQVIQGNQHKVIKVIKATD